MTSEPDVEKEDTEREQSTEKESTSETEAPKKPVYSDSESSDEEDERELGGRTYSEKGVEVRLFLVVVFSTLFYKERKKISSAYTTANQYIFVQ